MEISKKAQEALDDDVRAKIRACETSEDILALAKEEGVELSDEAISAISGGVDWISCTAVCCCPGVHDAH